METLMKMLSAASEGPAAEIQTGNPPVPPNVGITPVGDDPGILTSYCYLVELSALSALYTGIWELNTLKKRGREQPYNISIASEASQAFADLADAGFQTMIGSLAGSYNLSSAVSNSYTKQMRKTSLHFDFLDDLFKSFNLVSTAFTQLDGILSTFTIRINQVVRTNITGGDANPVWLTAVSKSFTDEGFEFKVHTVVVDRELNVEKFVAKKDKLDQIFSYVTDQNLQAFGEKTCPPPFNSKSWFKCLIGRRFSHE
ncbi:hypothetical protein MMC28_002353 [Mycoblastus sanguinarius]|nr:hypothetical protein [Mycoblastus sanguinarius]